MDERIGRTGAELTAQYAALLRPTADGHGRIHWKQTIASDTTSAVVLIGDESFAFLFSALVNARNGCRVTVTAISGINSRIHRPMCGS